MTLAALGIEIQKEITKKLFKKRKEGGEGEGLEDIFEEEGSVLVAERDQLEDLREEYELLKKVGCEDVVWWGEKELKEVNGGEGAGGGGGFVGGIYFPSDTRINALAYVEALTRAVEKARDTRVTVIEHCPPVVGYREEKGGKEAVVLFENGVEVKGGWVVVASNGLFLDGKLAGFDVIVIVIVFIVIVIVIVIVVIVIVIVVIVIVIVVSPFLFSFLFIPSFSHQTSFPLLVLFSCPSRSS